MDCFRCEWVESGDASIGDFGRGPCYSMGVDDCADRCEACQKREPLFQEMVKRKRVEKLAFRRLCALIERLALVESDSRPRAALHAGEPETGR